MLLYRISPFSPPLIFLVFKIFLGKKIFKLYLPKIVTWERENMGTREDLKLIDVSKISIRFQVVIPKEVREILGVKEGDKIAWYKDQEGNIVVKRLE
ncbi:MAG: hypothetical protein DRJ69_06715 [Thermoprotei archaeon]|nr:MAG: hypothetical protein DRJ69_06715 [Thermoprotei archaeon]